MKKNLVECLMLLLLSIGFGAVHATPIDLWQQQDITVGGQGFVFIFPDLPDSYGRGGRLSITLDGDYSLKVFPPLSEGATARLDDGPGILELYNDIKNGGGVGSNSIGGLSLNSSSKVGMSSSYTLDYVFDITPALLKAILADHSVTVKVKNTWDVAFISRQQDFVGVGLSYDGGPNGSRLCENAILGILIETTVSSNHHEEIHRGRVANPEYVVPRSP